VALRLVPAAVCALGAHALLYGAVRPGDGLHGYFGWYEPALAVVSLAALLMLRPSSLKTLQPVSETARGLSTTALVFLLAQESLERSLAAGHPAFTTLTPSQWLVLLAGIGATALVLAFGLRAGQAFVALLQRRDASLELASARWSVVVDAGRRLRPLASRSALRAPPLAA
jgi:hypothetical protein